MNIERGLYEKIGETAYKLHTGRSRNEQIVLDERLFLIKTTDNLEKALLKLLRSIVKRAKENCETIIQNQVLIWSPSPDKQTGGCFLASHNPGQ